MRVRRVCCGAAGSDAGAARRTYALDVLEQIGDDLAREHYWDYGLFSHLQRQYSTAPEGVTLLRVLGQPLTPGDSLSRWTALLPQLLLHLASLCPDSVDHAYAQVQRPSCPHLAS